MSTRPADVLAPVLVDLGSDASRDAYRVSWQRWVKHGGPGDEHGLVTLNVDGLKAIKAALSALYKPATVKRSFIVAHLVWRSLQATESVADPFTRVKVPVGDNVPEWNVLQKGELRTLADKLDGLPSLERAVVLALGLQGWRKHVLCELKWSAVHRDQQGHYAEFKSKRGALRRQRIHSEVMAAVKALKQSTAPDMPFLAWKNGEPLTGMRIYRIITRACAKFLSKHITPHGLRATFISDAIQRKGLEFARQQAGQKDIKTTQRYSRWTLDDGEEVPL